MSYSKTNTSANSEVRQKKILQMNKLLLISLLLLSSLNSWCQSALLSQKIELNVVNQPLDIVLKSIEARADVRFSYNPKVINANKLITYKTNGSSLENILIELLGKEFEGKVRGNHIILQKSKTPEKKDFYITGYIRDGETGEEITNVSVYEPLTLASTLSNLNGYYKIKLPKDQPDLGLRFSKENYDVAIVEIYGRTDQRQNVTLLKTMKPKVLTEPTFAIATPKVKIDSTPKNLQEYIEMAHPQPVEVPEVKTSTKKVELPKLDLPKIDLSDEFAAIDSGYRKGKDDFLNWLLTTKQNFHLRNNIDSLYRPFQISLLPYLGTNLKLSPFVTNDVSINIIAGYTGSVRKLEFGGFANVVRENMTGLQAAGALNIVGKRTDGVQLAGSSNFNIGDAHGFIAAGATNFNFKNGSGVHMAGALNFNLGSFTGLQIAPVNVTGTLINATQLGVFNFANEQVNSLPIGFFSYVHKNGYRRFEIAFSELNATELSFKSGVKGFYNVFNASFNYGQANKPLFGVGYGLGTSWNYSKRFSSNLEAVVMSYVPETDDYFDNWNSHLRLSLGFEAKITKRVAIFAAPTLNFYTSSNDGLDFSEYKFLLSQRNVNWFGDNSNAYSWLGYKVGLRICNKS